MLALYPKEEWRSKAISWTQVTDRKEEVYVSQVKGRPVITEHFTQVVTVGRFQFEIYP